MAPITPIALEAARRVEASALLDTGAALNVLPYGVGAQLGFLWDHQNASVQPTGNLASVEARVVLVTATVGQFPPVRLAFAWANQDGIPVILGQMNSFLEFDVCFFRARSIVDVRPRS